jgi:hypothetical protein
MVMPNTHHWALARQPGLRPRRNVHRIVVAELQAIPCGGGAAEL